MPFEHCAVLLDGEVIHVGLAVFTAGIEGPLTGCIGGRFFSGRLLREDGDADSEDEASKGELA